MMEQRAGRAPSPAYAESGNEADVEMEAGECVPRWSIPRPSLSSSSGGSISSGGCRRGCGGTRGGCHAPCHARAGGKHCRAGSSSQGSASNHSTQSASSGSLLLSAANLAQVGNHHSPTRLSQSSLTNYQNNLSTYVNSVGSASVYGHEKTSQMEVTAKTNDQTNLQNHSDPFWNHVKLASAKNQRRDLKDTESVASSTHFTVVNGFTRHGRSTKSESQVWCCKRTHQITVLVVTMTVLFTAGILAAICYIEMRQRRDVGSRFS